MDKTIEISDEEIDADILSIIERAVSDHPVSTHRLNRAIYLAGMKKGSQLVLSAMLESKIL